MKAMNFADFKKRVNLSNTDICREIFAGHRDAIRVKKEKTVVRNLERIFDATLKISNRKGFQAMSMRDLSKETELSMGALYAYFSSKEELLEMLQMQRRSITWRILSEHLEAIRLPADRLRAAIRIHLYLSEAMQPWFYFAYMETKHLSKKDQEDAKASELATEKIFIDILEDGVSQGVFRETDTTLVAGAIKALLQDWYLKRWKYSKRKISVDSYAAFVIDTTETYVNAATRPH